MEWITVDDETKTPPFNDQVLIRCGAMSFFGWLRKIEITSGGRKFIWEKQTPKDFDDYIPTHWMKIDNP